MKITDLKCAVIGQNPVVRIVTDEGISGYGAGRVMQALPQAAGAVLQAVLIGRRPDRRRAGDAEDPPAGRFKPWGSAVSAIEMALWDIAGKAAGLPVYKLLGGKVRDRVRVYNGGVRFPMTGYTPEDYAENMARDEGAPRRASRIIKQGVGFHSPMPRDVPELLLRRAAANASRRIANAGC